MKLLRSTLFLAAGFALASTASAQSSYTFDVNQSASNFTFGGNSSLGQIKGRPGTFNMDGEMDMQLSYAGGGFISGQFAGGTLFTVPSRITAEIPNVFSFLPPIATIHIDNAQYTSTSGVFAIDPAGNFTTDIVMTPVGGTVTVIPLVGSTEVSNLADYGSTDPTPVSGNVTPDFLGGANLVMPVDVDFISDDGMGNFVQINLDGTLEAFAASSNDMTLSTPGAVVAGAMADMNVINATPSTPTFLAYGLSLGTTPVPPLNIDLDLAGAQQLGGTVIADAQGDASWTLPVPSNASGVTAYLQSCQNGRKSNVLTINIQ